MHTKPSSWNVHHTPDSLLKQEEQQQHQQQQAHHNNNTDVKLDKHINNTNKNSLSCVDGVHIIMSVIARDSALNIPNIPM